MEDEEAKNLLKRNFELSRENNKLLKKIRRNGLIANIMRLVWWIIIVGVPLYVYYHVLQPYITEVNTTYQGVQDGVTGAQHAVLDVPFIKELVKAFIQSSATSTPHM